MGNQVSFIQKRESLIWIVGLLLGLGVFYLSWPTGFYFLNDDFVHIPQSGKGIIGQQNSIRFVGDLSLLADYSLFKKKAWGYHLTNRLLHFTNVVLFGLIARKVLPDPVKHLAIIMMAGFALYGFHSEAIFWVIGRSATLGFLFLALAVFCLLNLPKSEFYAVGYYTCWMLSLFSYESVWVWPPVLILLFFTQNKKNVFQIKWPLLAGTLLIFFGYLLIRKLFTNSWLGAYEAAAFEQIQVKTLIFNFGKLIFRTLAPPLNDGHLYIGFSIGILLPVIIGFSARVKLFMQDQFWWALLIGWLFSYLPYLSLGISLFTPESERFLYLPSALFTAFYVYTLATGFSGKRNQLPTITMVAFMVFHVIMFHKSSQQYQAAGGLVRETYKSIQNHSCDRLVINHLPETVYGLPTFRKGFEEGQQWLLTDRESHDLIYIASRRAFVRGMVEAKTTMLPNGNCLISYTENLQAK